jgi:MFS transporter, DHA1 family, tetracycline resistance protein
MLQNLRRIAPCLLAILVDALGFGLVYPILAMLFTGAHHRLLGLVASSEQLDFVFGLAYMLYPAGMFFGASLLGDLSDHFGRKPVLLICVGGLAAAFAGMALGVSFCNIWLLLGGRLLSGLMAGSQPIAQAAVSDLSSNTERAANMSLLTLALSVGIVAGPLMGGILSDRIMEVWFNFATPLATAALIASVAFVWLWFGFTDPSTPSHGSINWLRPVRIFGEAWQRSNVRPLVLAHLLFQCGFSLYYAMIPVQLSRRFAYGSAELGFFNGLIGAAFVTALVSVMPLLSRTCSDQAMAIGGLVLNGSGVFLSGLPLPAWVLWVLAFVLGVGDMVAYTAILTLFSKSVPADRRGWAMGIATAVMAVAWALTGFAPNLLGEVPLGQLIAGSGICVLLAGIVLLARGRAALESAEAEAISQ